MFTKVVICEILIPQKIASTVLEKAGKCTQVKAAYAITWEGREHFGRSSYETHVHVLLCMHYVSI